MEANEIRIGNWLWRNKIYGIGIWSDRLLADEGRLQISSIGEGGVQYDLAYYDDDDVSVIWEGLQHYEGIPLTPEILEKCGMINGGVIIEYEYYFFPNDVFHFYFELTPEGLSLYVGAPTEYETKTILKYVHQLQNLYFALTGEELNVDLHSTAK